MKKIIYACLTALIVLSAAVSPVNAKDITTQQKFDALKAKGIFSGNPDGQGSDQTMTRAEAAKVIDQLAGLSVDGTPTAPTYKDVDSSSWYYNYIEAATKAGYFKGKGNGVFDPTAQITTKEMLVDLDKVLGVDPKPTTNASPWAQSYVSAAVQAGLINSSTDFTALDNRSTLVDAAYSTYNLNTTVEQMKKDNKKGIGQLLALGVMSAEKNQFKPNQPIGKNELIQVLKKMTNNTNIDTDIEISSTPTFADLLRSMLHIAGYPMDQLKDTTQLIDQATQVGILQKDDPMIKMLQLDQPVDRQWTAYLTSRTLMDADTVTINSEGKVQLNPSNHLIDHMNLPNNPVQVSLTDMKDIPSFYTIKSIDPLIEKRVNVIRKTNSLYTSPFE